MNQKDLRARIDKLATALQELTEPQFNFIEDVVSRFRRPFINIERHPSSDIVDHCLLRNFGDVLRIHHCFSKQSLSKDRFEYALEKTVNMCGKSAELAGSRTNRGHDITIDGTLYSLKTQADKAIKEDELHISKFMELGKGRWPSNRRDLGSLRDMFLAHMQNYERILTLRCLSGKPTKWWYELVEIPKSLLVEADHGKLEMRRDTKQATKPGHCRVYDQRGSLKFELYFDAGSERKLQVRHLRKDLCSLHATWIFSTEPENTTGQASAESV